MKTKKHVQVPSEKQQIRDYRSRVSSFMEDIGLKDCAGRFSQKTWNILFANRTPYLRIESAGVVGFTHKHLNTLKGIFCALIDQQNEAENEDGYNYKFADLLTHGVTLMLLHTDANVRECGVDPADAGIICNRIGELLEDKKLETRLQRSIAAMNVKLSSPTNHVKTELTLDKNGHKMRFVFLKAPESRVVIDHKPRKVVRLISHIDQREIHMNMHAIDPAHGFPDEELGVWMQWHAYNRLCERMDVVTPPYAYAYLTFAMIGVKKIVVSEDHSFLIPIALKTDPVAYARCKIVDQKIIVLTVIPLLSPSTPEGSRMKHLFGLRKLDYSYLNFDHLSAFRSINVLQDKSLISMLNEAGCNSLTEESALWDDFEEDRDSMTREIERIKKYLMLDAWTEEPATEATASTDLVTSPVEQGAAESELSTEVDGLSEMDEQPGILKS